MPTLTHSSGTANGWYSENLFQTLTGKSLANLWTEYRTTAIRGPGAIPVAGKNNACLDGTGPKVGDCAATTAKGWTVVDEEAGTFMLLSGGDRCLDVSQSGTSVGTNVGIYACNNTRARKWTRTADGKLMNPQAGLCAAPVEPAPATGTAIKLAKCADAPAFDVAK